ncbi:hypothetical protein AB0K18_10430 [Nonomuraea sp. NPDC049421]|uniref:hypothetical protein n=1 Tax=Nonomuraea sp. NPDC049421 TaxID=3155275 RepID=UPI0034258293
MHRPTFVAQAPTTTAGKEWKKTFQKSAQADGYRSKLVTAARDGEAFSLLTGEPVKWNRADQVEMTWYEFACKFADFKWKSASAKYRQDIARALTAATPALLRNGKGKPDDLTLRTAMRRWGFNSKQRAESPEEMADALAWLAKNTLPVSALAEAATVRSMLDTATAKLSGKPAATSTIRRNKTILQNALDYAIELKLLTTNPIKSLKWKPPKVTYEVDKRSVVNPAQARRLLTEVGAQKPSGKRLVAFFGAMYYAGLRPEEAVNLRRDNVTIPELVANPETGEMEPPADDWENSTSPVQHPSPAASGPMTAPCAKKGRSSTAPKVRHALCHALPRSPSSSAPTSPSSTLAPADGSSPAFAVTNCPASLTGVSGPRREQRP